MAGIYVHIPFCRKACRYCDFYFTVSSGQKDAFISAIIHELINRKNELVGEPVETIYFGGGTPSVLEPAEVSEVIKTIYENFIISDRPEVNFEANPDDLSPGYIEAIKEVGINRLSIGIQSFYPEDLQLLRRSHTNSQSLSAISNSIQSGFHNINIDLIYGIPGQEENTWKRNLDIALSFGIQHISAYHLTFEAGTVFDHWKKKGKISPIDEEQSVHLLDILIEKTFSAGFDHYEISNFALPGYISRHNTNYWRQVNYLGVGPSAHSYNGKMRRWNVSNNSKYIHSVQNKLDDYFESEILSVTDLYHEYIMTSLRTKWGININLLRYRFGEEYLNHLISAAEKFIQRGELSFDGEIIKLTRKGIFLTDYIISELFTIEDPGIFT